MVINFERFYVLLIKRGAERTFPIAVIVKALYEENCFNIFFVILIINYSTQYFSLSA